MIAGGFTAEELAAIVDRPTVDVLAELLALADDDVLNERDGRLSFRHDIIRQAIVEATPTPIVRSLNRRAAELLTASGADRTRIAGCLLIAADIDDPHDVAALVELGLALRDEREYAAADVLQRALDGLHPSDTRFVEVALALGWALADLGRLPEVGAVLDLLDAARSAASRRAPPARQRAELAGSAGAGLCPVARRLRHRCLLRRGRQRGGRSRRRTVHVRDHQRARRPRPESGRLGPPQRGRRRAGR